jgi:hypothetical protein
MLYIFRHARCIAFLPRWPYRKNPLNSVINHFLTYTRLFKQLSLSSLSRILSVLDTASDRLPEPYWALAANQQHI